MRVEIALKRVEEEVRVELRFERLQTSLGEPRLEVSGPDRPALRLALIADRVGQRRDRRVCHQHPVHVGEVLALHVRRPGHSGGVRQPGPQHPPDRNHARDVKDRERRDGQRMCGEGARPAAGFELVSIRQPENEGCDGSRHIPQRQIQDEQTPRLDIHPVSEREGAQAIGLEGGEKTQGRRGAEHQSHRRRPDLLHGHPLSGQPKRSVKPEPGRAL